jgi:hypothetical protein
MLGAGSIPVKIGDTQLNSWWTQEQGNFALRERAAFSRFSLPLIMHNQKETCLQMGIAITSSAWSAATTRSPREKLATPLGAHDVHNPELARAYMHNYHGKYLGK